MTTQTIYLNYKHSVNSPARQVTPNNTSIAGRSVVPCPPKLSLTDTQIKKVCLVAFALFSAIVAPVIIGALTFGAVGAAPALAMAFVGSMLGGSLFTLWPEIDYQTPEQAAIIWKDLQSETLLNLRAKYDFFDLASYGYISKSHAEKMEKLNAMRPDYYIPRLIDGHLMYWTTDHIVHRR